MSIHPSFMEREPTADELTNWWIDSRIACSHQSSVTLGTVLIFWNCYLHGFVNYAALDSPEPVFKWDPSPRYAHFSSSAKCSCFKISSQAVKTLWDEVMFRSMPLQCLLIMGGNGHRLLLSSVVEQDKIIWHVYVMHQFLGEGKKRVEGGGCSE